MSDQNPKDGTLPQSRSRYGLIETREKGSSPISTIIFAGLRGLDVPLQWWILRSGAGVGLLQRLGATTVLTPSTLSTGTLLGLSPYHTIVVGLAAGCSLKHIYWKLFVGQEVMEPSFATVISIWNSVMNTGNTLLALWIVTSQQPSDQSSLGSFLATAPPSVYIGVPLYLLGLYTEWWSELQRKSFKADPRNKGKAYAGGLFGLARNINYGGYTVWRMSYGLVCGGWSWAAAKAGLFAWDFGTRAIPSMDIYCQKRYGEQWDEVRRAVPYKLLPWIW